MQDLIDKINELRKGLGVAKPKENALVPALSLPSVKPLSVSSSSGGSVKPPKLPGVAPATGKDPKKMAQQLKNPRPKSPKIEVMKADEQHYRIHVDGNPVTQPMPLHHIVSQHGPIKHIESNPGHRVVPVKAPQMPKMSKNGQWLSKFGEGNSV